MFYTLYTVYTVSINRNIRGEYIFFVFCVDLCMNFLLSELFYLVFQNFKFS